MPYVTGTPNPDFSWKFALDKAQLIERFVRTADSAFQGIELVVYNAGRELANWERFENRKEPEEPYDPSRIELIKKYISALFDGSIPSIIEQSFQDFEKDKEWQGIKIQSRIYNQLRNLLTEKEALGL
jgi:hypothetical protein